MHPSPQRPWRWEEGNRLTTRDRGSYSILHFPTMLRVLREKLNRALRHEGRMYRAACTVTYRSLNERVRLTTFSPAQPSTTQPPKDRGRGSRCDTRPGLHHPSRASSSKEGAVRLQTHIRARQYHASMQTCSTMFLVEWCMWSATQGPVPPSPPSPPSPPPSSKAPHRRAPFTIGL